MFRDFGLSTASVQRTTVTEDQISTLFWINLAVGAVLAALCVAVGAAAGSILRRALAANITIALAAGFLLNGAAVQHRALLQRRMQFGALAIIDVLSLVLAIIMSISMAVVGLGYWAVVVMTVFPQIACCGGRLDRRGVDAAAAQTRFWPQAAAQVRRNADPQQPGHARGV